MSIGTETQQQANNQVIEQERRRIGRHLDDIARLAESDVPPSTFYGEVLKRLLDALAAPAGAVWLRTSKGTPQLHYQINLNQAGTERNEQTRQGHEGLLLMALHQAQPQPVHLLPNTTVGPADEGKPAPGNPTDNILLLVPVMQNEQTVGLLEVFQSPNRPLNAVPGFLQYMSLMADLCSRYLRNQKMSHLAGQQQLWTQLEAYARQVHGSLNPVEVAYLVANEGRRLIECDRVSVAIRYGPRTAIESVSGADVVEKRSNLVKLMRILCDRVLSWGEKLVFQGKIDDSLPPRVLSAMNDYLLESNSKLLVVQPLKDEREGKDSKKPSRAAVVMECFEPPTEVQPLLDRGDVVTRHATSALYNAVEHRRIPMRFLWMPLAHAQEGLGGKARAIWMLVCFSLTLLVTVMVLWPLQLKMEAKGELLPVVRRKLYSPVDAAIVKKFWVHPGDEVRPGGSLATLYDLQQRNFLAELDKDIKIASDKAKLFNDQANKATKLEDREAALGNAKEQERILASKQKEKEEHQKFLSADAQNRGFFLLRAPEFTEQDLFQLRDYPGVKQEWKLLNSNFEDDFAERGVKTNDPILSIGLAEGPWEAELKIPQKNIGQVLSAFPKEDDPVRKLKKDTLVVEFLLLSDPTKAYQGILHRSRIAAEANANKDDTSEAEPVVVAYLDIEDKDIPADKRLPRNDRTAGTEVHARILCGDHAMGYSLFYGVWEFLYEKVVFPFF